MKTRKLIVFDGEKWSVRTGGETDGIWTTYKTLADVPEVAELLDKLRDLLEEQCENDMREVGERE